MRPKSEISCSGIRLWTSKGRLPESSGNPVQSLILQHPAEEKPAVTSPASLQEEGCHLPPNLFDDSPLGMALVDSQFRILKANRSFCHILDYTESEIISLHIPDMAREQNACRQMIGQVLDGVLPISRLDGEFRKKNGADFWVRIAASAVPGKNCCLIVTKSSAAWA